MTKNIRTFGILLFACMAILMSACGSATSQSETPKRSSADTAAAWMEAARNLDTASAGQYVAAASEIESAKAIQEVFTPSQILKTKVDSIEPLTIQENGATHIAFWRVHVTKEAQAEWQRHKKNNQSGNGILFRMAEHGGMVMHASRP